MARPQGRQALGASSHERLWAVIDALVPDSSLCEATALWMRVTFDSLREDAADPAKAFEVMARLAERQLPSPAVLNAWMHAVCDLRYTRKVWEARVRGWIDKAWEQGVRPDAGPAWGALRHVLAPMRVLQGSQSAQSLSWLVDAFASAPPSPQWMCVALAEVRFEHHEPARVALFEALPRLPASSAWSDEDLKAWQDLWPTRTHRLDKKSVAMQVQVRAQALAWGLANGLPVDTVLSGPNAFLPLVMEPILQDAVDQEDLLMDLFALAFAHGLSLRSPIGLQQQPWHQVLQQQASRYPSAPPPGWTPAQAFWNRRKPDVERLEAQARARQLEHGWASPKACDSPSTGPRL